MIACPSCGYAHPNHLTAPQCLQCHHSFEDVYVCMEQSCRYNKVFQPRSRQCVGCGRMLIGQYSGERIEWGHSIFRVREFVGGGGMGEVYRGIEQDHSATYQREVAIKFNKNMMDLDVVKRFQLEVQVLSMLQNPHNIRVYTYGELFEERSTGMEAKAQFMVMELLKGQALNEVIEKGPSLSLHEVVQIFIEVCGALAEAHRKGVIHRDIKPHNIMLQNVAGDRFAKVFDFGLSRMTHSMDARISTSGVVMGTFRYMSPEQALGEELDHRTDIFSIGVVMYEMLSGRHPFPAKNLFELFMLHQEGAPSIQGLPSELEAIVRKTIAYEKDQRFQSCEEMRQTLQMWAGESLSGRYVLPPDLQAAMAGNAPPPQPSGGVLTRSAQYSRQYPQQHLSQAGTSPMHSGAHAPLHSSVPNLSQHQQAARDSGPQVHETSSRRPLWLGLSLLCLLIIGGISGYALFAPPPEPVTPPKTPNIRRLLVRSMLPPIQRTGSTTVVPRRVDTRGLPVRQRVAPIKRRVVRVPPRRRRYVRRWRPRRRRYVRRRPVRKQVEPIRRRPIVVRQKPVVVRRAPVVEPRRAVVIPPRPRIRKVARLMRRRPVPKPCPTQSGLVRYNQMDGALGRSLNTRMIRKLNRAALSQIYDSGTRLSQSWRRAAVVCKRSYLCNAVGSYVNRYCQRYRPSPHCSGYRSRKVQRNGKTNYVCAR